MKQLVVFPRVAPSGRVRVWVGLDAEAEANPAPPAFTLDGAPIVPDVLRPWGTALPSEHQDASAAPVFCGIFEFPLAVGHTSQLRVQTSGCTQERPVRTLPDRVPALADSPRNRFNVLLMSCYDYTEEVTRGVVDGLISELRSSLHTRPDVVLLAGDQVYLDMPLAQNFRDDVGWMMRKFHEDYRRNWFGRIPGVLSAAPAVHLPDDHEYWNNYPHTSPIIRNAETQDGRRRWTRAAGEMYAAFQHHTGNDPTAASCEPFLTFDVEPLSFFVADLRSQRSEKRAFVLPASARQQLRAWAERVRDKRQHGIFISGQSLVVREATSREGKWADWELRNYADYAEIMRALGTAMEAERTLLCVTGDVHWGRLTRFQNGRRKLLEIIASPAALVSDPRSSVKGFFRFAQDFPRHPKSEDAPEFLMTGAAKFARDPKLTHQQRGDHVALLSFQRTAKGVNLTVTYYPVHRERQVRAKTSKLETLL